MTTAEQRFSAEGVTRINIDAERTDLVLRWVDSEEVRLTGDGIEIERQDDEVWIGMGDGSGTRTFFSSSRMEPGDEGVAFRLGDLGEFIAGGKEGVSFRVKDIGEFSAGPEGVNIIGSGQEIHIGGDVTRRRKSRIGKEEKNGKSKRSRDRIVEIDLPVTLPALSVELRHGDLSIEDANGSIDLRLDEGDVTVQRGQASISTRAGKGNVSIDNVNGNLAIEGGSGDIRLETITGRVAVTAGSGDLTLIGVDGNTAVTTGSGDLWVAGGTGNLAIQTGSGDVSIRERTSMKLAVMTGSGEVSITGGSSSGVAVQTGSGDISCRTALSPDDHELRTGSGDISLEVPHDLSARFKVSTSRGRVDSEIPLVTVGQRGPRSLLGRRLVGSIGEAAERADISLRTAQGDVRLRWTDALRAAPQPSQAPSTTPASPPASVITTPSPTRSDPSPITTPRAASETDVEQERRGVLEALATGTISVEEAGRLLDALSTRTSP